MFVNGRAQSAPFAPTFLDGKISQDVPWVTLDSQNVVQFAYRSFGHSRRLIQLDPLILSANLSALDPNHQLQVSCNSSTCESKLSPCQEAERDRVVDDQ